jgi:TfoX/Sxy family transcriptional regulator of competence genes
VKFSKSPAWLVQLFDALQPEVGGTRRQMFGYPCAFENGQLFSGLFADGLFVRLGEGAHALVPGGMPFEPMKGRPMKQYAVLPAAMLEDEEAVKSWMQRGLEYARSLPAKKPKKRKSSA